MMGTRTNIEYWCDICLHPQAGPLTIVLSTLMYEKTDYEICEDCWTAFQGWRAVREFGETKHD